MPDIQRQSPDNLFFGFGPFCSLVVSICDELEPWSAKFWQNHGLCGSPGGRIGIGSMFCFQNFHRRRKGEERKEGRKLDMLLGPTEGPTSSKHRLSSRTFSDCPYLEL